jgi:hypothetical protein
MQREGGEREAEKKKPYFCSSSHQLTSSVFFCYHFFLFLCVVSEYFSLVHRENERKVVAFYTTIVTHTHARCFFRVCVCGSPQRMFEGTCELQWTSTGLIFLFVCLMLLFPPHPSPHSLAFHAQLE